MGSQPVGALPQPPSPTRRPTASVLSGDAAHPGRVSQPVRPCVLQLSRLQAEGSLSHVCVKQKPCHTATSAGPSWGSTRPRGGGTHSCPC